MGDTRVCDLLTGGSPVGKEYSCRIKDSAAVILSVSIYGGKATTVNYGFTQIISKSGNCGGGEGYNTGKDMVNAGQTRDYMIKATTGTCERFLIYLCTSGGKDVDCSTSLQVSFTDVQTAAPPVKFSSRLSLLIC